MPAIFVTPKPHHGFIPQILKDQACTNESKKEYRTRRECNKFPSWDNLPDDWDFDHYNNWDINPATD